MKPIIKKILSALPFFCLCLYCQKTFAQSDSPVKVLLVIAHPDDESGMAATIYKITHDLGGIVDICVVTNGEGGYKYSTLAEAYYGIELTDEKTGRENLPLIRKRELMNAGKIIGIHNYFFLDQVDDRYQLDERDPLDTVWDVKMLKLRLHDILLATRYNYVFNLLPLPSTHGGHKAASMLSLQAVRELPAQNRPVVLAAGFLFSKEDSNYVQLKNYTETKIDRSVPPFVFDRTMKFGYKNALDYRLVGEWELAEHKSQGSTQMAMLRSWDKEMFYYYDLNGEAGIAKTKALFEKLKVNHFKARKY